MAVCLDLSSQCHHYASSLSGRCADFIGFYSLASMNIMVQFSLSVMSNFLWPHGLQHARLSCALPTPGACSNSYPLSQWCHPTISSSVSSSHPNLITPVFKNNDLPLADGKSIGVSASASVFLVNIQDWFPLRLTGWISFQSKGLSRVFSNTTVSIS